jgi:flagellar hook-basal body complex protein FliE
MNALSSIRQLWSAAPAALGSVNPGGPATSSIPTAELRELNASQTTGVTAPTDGSFSGLLGQMVQDVNAKQNGATQALQDLQSGQSGSLHQTMIAMEEANVSFQLMVEVRNRLMDSYQELMKMQV